MPYLLRPLRVSRRLIELVHGVTRLDPELAGVAVLDDEPETGERLLVSNEVRAEAIALLGKRGGPALVVVGPEGSGRKTLLAAAAAANRCGVLRISCAALPRDPEELARVTRAILREAVLFRALPLFDEIDVLLGDEPAGDGRLLVIDAALADYTGPLAATSRREGKAIPFSRGTVRLDLAVPGEADREKLWRAALGDGAGKKVDLARVAGRYPVTGGVILRAAAAARSIAGARAPAGKPGEASPIGEDDVHAGLRSVFEEKIAALGTRITWRQTWTDLVLPEDTMEGLQEFVARVRHRRRVYDEWGFSRKMAKGLGLSALFAGPPGTGKTMVAGIIAGDLGLDLYEIDLSRIVSKYVGETEKNLAQVFDAAEAGHSILLFDEADSLFAKRGEVKSSVDRYANLEVNYLLQRMERFSGITILTTNLESSIDQAFKRRIAFKLDFPMPEEEEREKLWRTMLPKEASVGKDIDFPGLARRYDMAGGHIRNAVLRAAFLAAADNSAIKQAHMKRAADLEYVAMGKVV